MMDTEYTEQLEQHDTDRQPMPDPAWVDWIYDETKFRHIPTGERTTV